MQEAPMQGAPQPTAHVSISWGIRVGKLWVDSRLKTTHKFHLAWFIFDERTARDTYLVIKSMEASRKKPGGKVQLLKLRIEVVDGR